MEITQDAESLIKAILTHQDYKRLSRSLKAFKNDMNMESLCKDIVFLVNSTEKAVLMDLVTDVIPKNKRKEFRKIVRDLERKQLQSLGHHSCESKENENAQERTSFLIMERESLDDNFGFKIRGDQFEKQKIIVSTVDYRSIADMSGLKIGYRIVNVNGINCRRARKVDIIKLVKGAKRLCLEVLYQRHTKPAQQEKNNANMTASTSGPKSAWKKVVISPIDDGWLGCCIRGGADYACDIHITLVDNDSPAQVAGLMKGDVITEVNGVSLYGKTHVQAVSIIMSSCAPLTLTVSKANTKHRCSEFEPKTPLRISSNHRRRPRVQAHEMKEEVHHSHTSLPGLHLLHAVGTPPPPYTAELPEAHKLLQQASSDCGSQLEPNAIEDSNALSDLCTNDTIEFCADPKGEVASNNGVFHYSVNAMPYQSVANVENSQSELAACSECTDRLVQPDTTSPGDGEEDVAGGLIHATAPPFIQNNTVYTFDSPEVETSNACSSSRKPSLLDDIKNFKHSMLRKPRGTDCLPLIVSTDKKQCNTANGLLNAINAAIENRARAFNYSFASWNASYESEDELQFM